jgi:hypothetical protein
MLRWDTSERIAKKAADLKNEFDAADESNRPVALSRWSEALDGLTVAFLDGKLLLEV